MAKAKKKIPKTGAATSEKSEGKSEGRFAKYPRHSLGAALRVPRAILDQNAGREATDRDAARFAGVGYHGPFRVELSSAIKYGLLERPSAGKVSITALARQILRPQKSNDEIGGMRQALLNAPVVSDVYKHFRGRIFPTNSS